MSSGRPRHRLAWLLLSTLLFSYSVYGSTPASFQIFLNQWRTQHHVTSVVVSIDHLNTQSVTHYTSGTLRQHSKQVVTPQALYGVGSIAKTFVAATLLQLQQEGKISLDSPIGQYFPHYPRWRTITIRQLLNMTSGITNFTEAPAFARLEQTAGNAPISPAQLIAIAYQHPDYFAPGQGWHYSNTNYYLAGLIIAQVTHEPLATVYQQRFFTPLGLAHTFYSDTFYPASVMQRMAHAYPNGRGTENAKTQFNASLFGPAGAMVMNSQDLLAWVHDLFIPGKVLSARSLEALETTTAVPEGAPRPAHSRYGLGVFTTVSPTLGHLWWYTGVIDGYTSVFVWIPRRNAIIVAQAASWPGDDYAILFPNQALMKEALRLEHL